MSEKSLEQRIQELEADAERLAKNVADFNEELKGRGKPNQELDPLVEIAAKWIAEDHGYCWEELTSNPMSSQIVALYRFKGLSLLQTLSERGGGETGR
jgi:hypothetical protein